MMALKKTKKKEKKKKKMVEKMKKKNATGSKLCNGAQLRLKTRN